MGTILRGVRNVLRSPIRLVLVVAILGTSLMFVAAMFALNASAQQRLDAARNQIGTGIDIRPGGDFGPVAFGGGGTLTAAQLKTIESTPGVQSISEEVTEQYSGTALKGSFTGMFKTVGPNGDNSGTRTVPPTIYGLMPGQDKYSLINGSVAKIASGRDLKSSETSADVALMGSALATANNLKVGSTFALEGTTFTLVGLFTTGSGVGDDSIIIPLQTAQTTYKIDGVSSVIVYAASASAVDGLVSKLKSALGSSVDVVAQSAAYSGTLSALDAAQSNIFTTLIVSIITAALVILFAVMLIVRERVREIGLLKAIGASHWQVVSQFGAEVLSLSGIAAAVALALLALLGGTLASKFDISSTPTVLNGGSGRVQIFFGGPSNPVSNAAQQPFSTGLSFGSLLVVLGIGMLLAVVASAIPAWYVARTKPADVLRAD